MLKKILSIVLVIATACIMFTLPVSAEGTKAEEIYISYFESYTLTFEKEPTIKSYDKNYISLSWDSKSKTRLTIKGKEKAGDSLLKIGYNGRTYQYLFKNGGLVKVKATEGFQLCVGTTKPKVKFTENADGYWQVKTQKKDGKYYLQVFALRKQENVMRIYLNNKKVASVSLKCTTPNTNCTFEKSEVGSSFTVSLATKNAYSIGVANNAKANFTLKQLGKDYIRCIPTERNTAVLYYIYNKKGNCVQTLYVRIK